MVASIGGYNIHYTRFTHITQRKRFYCSLKRVKSVANMFLNWKFNTHQQHTLLEVGYAEIGCSKICLNETIMFPWVSFFPEPLAYAYNTLKMHLIDLITYKSQKYLLKYQVKKTVGLYRKIKSSRMNL